MGGDETAFVRTGEDGGDENVGDSERKIDSRRCDDTSIACVFGAAIVSWKYVMKQ